ncbi:protein zyg-11 homolog isoform X2 [Mobula hypostoma]|uniref:protein zyg-11 homolog isoform X2 n=1 Tax=Mobula hypostoma TaxID=723540 RepID=UPI002FC3098F
MEDFSPLSLTDICLDYLRVNLSKFCWERTDGSFCLKEAVVFPQELADRLLQKMSLNGVLNEKTVGIFRRNDLLRLKRACIRNAKLSAVAFKKAFCHHKLIELDASGVNADITITDIVNALVTNKWNQQFLQCLVLNSLTLSLEDPYERCFSQLTGLRVLSVTNVLFYNDDLRDVTSLPKLESLDISNTSVTDITPLLTCKDRLKSLTMHHLKCLKMTTTQILEIIKELKLLQHLDISDDKQFTSDIALRLLGQSGILLNLRSLDISGRKHITDKAVQAFVQHRPTMQFMGLLATDAGYSAFLSGEGSLKLVVTGMKNHSTNLPVQLAASACVFNLTKQDLAAGMPVRLLTEVTRLLLKAMEHFPNHQQLQKNCLLSLCSDRILQDVPFNRFEAAKLVMQWLCNHEDQNMQRMAVAIISILAAKLSTEQTAQLGTELFIVKKLLHIVEQKTSQSLVDTTLKFTLSALWNLTDESPTTCKHFIENQGLELFMKVLESFPCEPSIQQKVLGLLNNIAEVKELHPHLMKKSFIEHISVLLHNKEVEVSYFAAGIIAHLISRGLHIWTLDLDLRASLLEQLHSVILNWPTPDCEMVAYRSFSPFFPLLECSDTPGVQIWAVWAMQHVCSKNAPRYCSMLIEEGGMQQLYNIKNHPQISPDVLQIVISIIESLETYMMRHGNVSSCHKKPQTKQCDLKNNQD